MAGIRVLIVDDAKQTRQDLQTLLNLAGGIEVAGEAGNGLEAIRSVEALRPQVVLMDLEMPEMDGYEATRRIKSFQPAPRVVILSFHAGPEEMELARQAGADAFVVKGVSHSILLNAILGKDGAPYFFDHTKGEKP